MFINEIFISIIPLVILTKGIYILEVYFMEDKMIVFEKKLLTNKADEYELNKRLRIACDIYNDLNNYYHKRYNELTNDKAWSINNKKIIRFMKSEEGILYAQKKAKGKATKPRALKELYDERNELIKAQGFSEFSFISTAMSYANKYAANIPSNPSAFIGKRLWVAYEKLLYGEGEQVRYRKRADYNSFSSNGKSAITLKRDETGRYYIKLSNIRVTKKVTNIYIDKSRSDYDDAFINYAHQELADANHGLGVNEYMLGDDGIHMDMDS